MDTWPVHLRVGPWAERHIGDLIIDDEDSPADALEALAGLLFEAADHIRHAAVESLHLMGNGATPAPPEPA
ncbi:hypothetical protein [Streptomyces sp. N35]|uniref:hypothetical protein n=1 Tax=Streptomyces sp. N35 TaxID=2795730 RepID=UPI0018F743AC|nr:hypothetical protein [Streptomyces sp. N35]